MGEPRKMAASGLHGWPHLASLLEVVARMIPVTVTNRPKTTNDSNTIKVCFSLNIKSKLGVST